jgi:type IV pilus assembly protein PilN
MVKINLLPWREELRQQKKQEFLAALGLAIALTLGIVGLIHIYYEDLKLYQEQRNRVLEQEIAELEKKIIEIKSIEEKKRKLLSKIDLIQKLQASRPEVVHLFDELPKTTPDGVFLSKFTQTGNSLAFEGKSQSNARVSAFMRAIEMSPWLDHPVLNVIKSSDHKEPDALSDFTLQANQASANP